MRNFAMVIEGNTENSGFSDLSHRSILGVDVKQKRQLPWGVCAVMGRPSPSPFKHVCVILIALINLSYSDDSYFRANSINLYNGNIIYTTGYSQGHIKPYAPQINFYQKSSSEIRARFSEIENKIIEIRKLREIKKQTEFLRKIANE